jgi:hypothetical protein
MSLMSKFNAPVASNNDGRRLFSKAPSKAYSDGWDAVFGKKERTVEERIVALVKRMAKKGMR